jgi:hypothetical protein
VTPPDRNAEEKLIAEFGKMLDEAAERMTLEELSDTATRAMTILNRAIVRARKGKPDES